MDITKNEINYKLLVSDILEFSEKFKTDVEKFKDFSIYEFYKIVNKLPYISDGDQHEILARPKYTLDENYKVNRDCDDKALILASYCKLKNINFRIIVSGRGKKPHHIYLEILIPNLGWLPIDATYPNINKIGFPLFKEKKREIFY